MFELISYQLSVSHTILAENKKNVYQYDVSEDFDVRQPHIFIDNLILL